jgi:cardiolipin synthase (CMP-forming)
MFKRELIADLRAAGYRPRAWISYVRGHADLALHGIIARPTPARSVVVHGVALFGLLFAFSLGLAFTNGLELGRRLFLWSSLWEAGLCVWVLVHLGLLVDLEGRPLDHLGLPNALSLLRGATVPPLVILAAARVWTLLAVVLAIGALSDVADGFVARRIGPLSRLGVIMDALVDIVWNTGAFLAFALAGLLPAWIMALVGLRYGLLLAGATVLYLRRTSLTIRPTRFGKTTGALISTGLGLVLANRLLVEAGRISGAMSAAAAGMLAIALALLAAATVMHVVFLGIVAERTRSRPPLILVKSQNTREGGRR